MALAPELGSPPGARLLESDRLRKAMFGADPCECLPADAYRPEISARVYEALNERARIILQGGGIAIVDAVFDKPRDRVAIAAVAQALALPFTGLWLEAPPAMLRERVQKRGQCDSDATVDVLESQLSRDPGPMDWLKLNAASPSQELTAQVLRMLEDQPASM